MCVCVCVCGILLYVLKSYKVGRFKIDADTGNTNTTTVVVVVVVVVVECMLPSTLAKCSYVTGVVNQSLCQQHHINTQALMVVLMVVFVALHFNILSLIPIFL